jgi:exodeoxyribonuclease VII large subunit
MEELKARLSAEGLFSESRKRPLPQFPQKIAVITSPYGSVWHDIQNVIGRRYPIVELILVETLVQGDEASNGITNSFAKLNIEDDLDLIILARGGGSAEELQPFNAESVARAIYSSKYPVISAIGHETDYTIADMVSDYRAPTPSAAAELAVPDVLEIRSRIHSSLNYSLSLIENSMVRLRQDINQTISDLKRRQPNTSLWKQKTDELSNKHKTTFQYRLTIGKERLKSYELQLKSLSPYDVLDRGYGFVEKVDPPRLISSIKDVQSGDNITITVRDGSFSSEVT